MNCPHKPTTHHSQHAQHTGSTIHVGVQTPMDGLVCLIGVLLFVTMVYAVLGALARVFR